jgi:hypothetical protein
VVFLTVVKPNAISPVLGKVGLREGQALRRTAEVGGKAGLNTARRDLALQLSFCFEVRAPSDRLVSSAPE